MPADRTPQLGQQGLDKQLRRGDHCVVAVQRRLVANGVDATLDGLLVANIARTEERLEGFATSALRSLQRRPALKEVREDGCVFVSKPIENLREIALQRGRDAIGEPCPVVHQIAPRFDQRAECPHRWALRLQPFRFVAVPDQHLQVWMARGRCSRTSRSRLSCPGTPRQRSCFLSPQSMPTNAAYALSSCLCMSGPHVRLGCGTCEIESREKRGRSTRFVTPEGLRSSVAPRSALGSALRRRRLSGTRRGA